MSAPSDPQGIPPNRAENIRIAAPRLVAARQQLRPQIEAALGWLHPGIEALAAGVTLPDVSAVSVTAPPSSPE